MTEPLTVDSEYLDFNCTGMTASGKTAVWAVVSKSSGMQLGQIKWWGAWRQYVFAPTPATVFNVGCMEDINAAITELMERRKQP